MPKAELPEEERQAAQQLKTAKAQPHKLTPFNVYAYEIPDNPTPEQVEKAVLDLSATPDWLTVEVATKQQPARDPKTGALDKDHKIVVADKEVTVDALRYGRHLLKESKVEHFPALMEGAIYSPKTGTWRTFGKGEYFQTVETRTTNEMLAWGIYRDKAILDVRKFLRRITFDDSRGKRSPFDDSAHPELVAFTNGTYNILTGQLEASKPENYLLNAHDYAIDPTNNAAPKTESLLKAMLGDAVTLFEEYVGYCFYHSHKPFTELLWLSGSGGEGKSTLLKDVVGRMLGRDNYAAQNPQDLSDPQKRFNSAELYGKEANIVADIADGFMKDTSMVKRLTGGDVISAEFKGITGFTFINYGKQIYAANSMPSFSDGSNGFGDRAMIIKMVNGDVRHGEAKARFWGQHPMNEVKAERSAFAVLCMQKFHAALAAGALTKPASVIEASNEWLTANDNLATYIAEGFEVMVGNANYFVQAPTFNEQYKVWRVDNGYSGKISSAKIRTRMEGKGFKYRAKKLDGRSIQCYLGIRTNGAIGY